MDESERRVDGSPQLRRIEDKLNEIAEAINGNPAKDIEGLRPRMRMTENNVARLLRLVEQDKMTDRVTLLEKTVEELVDERRRYKAWIAGLAVGLALTTITSLGGFVLQLANAIGRVP